MSIFVSSALFAAVIFLAALGLRAIEDIERENRLVEAELRASQLYRESLDERVEQVRRYRHDADGLLRAIEHSLGENTLEVACSKGSNANGAASRASSHVSSNAEAASAVAIGNAVSGEDAAASFLLSRASIQSKRRLCSDSGFAFTCDVDPRFFSAAVRRGVGDADLCIVLQNLLDNAYEASQNAQASGLKPSMSLRMTADEPDVSRTASTKPGPSRTASTKLNASPTAPGTPSSSRAEASGHEGLRIEIRNATADARPPEFRTHKPQPHLHGIGLQAVRDIIRAHGGRLDSHFNEATRVVTIVARL